MTWELAVRQNSQGYRAVLCVDEASPFKLNAGYPLVILLHDFGASMYDLTGIASGMNDRGYIYACSIRGGQPWGRGASARSGAVTPSPAL